MAAPTLDALLRQIIREEVEAALGRLAPPTTPKGRAGTWQVLETTKLGRFSIKSGSPVRVHGERGAFTVARIERNEAGKVVVDVTSTRTGHSRSFALDQLKYVRPGSKRATDQDDAARLKGGTP